MKDYKLEDGDLVKKSASDLKIIDGMDAAKQSMLIRLNVERGSFIYDETLGSRIKLLYREKRSKISEMANIYVREALEQEKDIVIEKVNVEWVDKKKILILVFFSWNGISDSLEVIA